MKTLNQILGNIELKETEGQALPMQSTQLVKKSEEVKSELVPFTPENKEQLNKALGACLAVQRTYGKQAGDFDKVVQVFIKVLEGYEPEKIMQAIKKWVMVSPEFPTPADILGILNPQPKFDYAVYNRLCDKQKRGEQMQYQENEYIKAYERNAINGL